MGFFTSLPPMVTFCLICFITPPSSEPGLLALQPAISANPSSNALATVRWMSLLVIVIRSSFHDESFRDLDDQCRGLRQAVTKLLSIIIRCTRCGSVTPEFLGLSARGPRP